MTYRAHASKSRLIGRLPLRVLEARPYRVLCGWLVHSECSWSCTSCGILLNCVSAIPPLRMCIHAI